jgi:membrane-associated protease RseP (regulator of RpoE activity)
MIISFLISLIIIIFCHEFAHLITAKKLGCGVDIFSIGFGKPFYRKEYKGTIYQISFLLFGGYCKLRDELKDSNDPHAFTNLTYHKKVYIALAGVMTNMIMGLIIIYLGKLFGFKSLIYFGYLSFLLGATNTIPFPALDGSYPILVWLEKFYGKEKGCKLMEKINRIGFIILMALQIACIPYIIYIVKNGELQ